MGWDVKLRTRAEGTRRFAPTERLTRHLLAAHW